MYQQLVSILVVLALGISAGSPLPYGHSLIALPLLLGGSVPDEPSNERPRVLGTAASTSKQSVPALAYERTTVQSVSTVHMLAMSAAALARLSGATPRSSTDIPVPLRC
jgi:hypothetical protein